MGERPPKKNHISIVSYIAGAFMLTAAMTVLITASALVIGYNINRGSEFGDEGVYFALIIAAVAALLLSVVLGLFFARSIGQPIQKITKAASSIKEGDLTARTNLFGDDELSQLGKTFDEMADSIQRDRDLERQLIGDVAHELRTPLMAIQATVEAIQDGVFPADEEHLATISSETRRLGRLVEALLHLNRLENGTVEVKRELVDVSDLVNDLTLTNEALVESSGLTFVSEIEPEIKIIGDHDLVMQAVANLLSNAVRYTPEGGTITLRARRIEGNASISVTDTGVGLAKEDLDKVFSRFWRADSARSNISGGLGIGLALVKEVADQHSGSVSVESVLGEGSTFTINIPLAREDVSRASTEKQPRAARRVAREARREAKREQDKQRKAQEKLRKLQERQDRDARRAAAREQKSGINIPNQLTLFGIRVPLPSKKDNDDDSES
ncbi:MAG: HAMP domain-containing sensor histidine kinase [Coriobacteriales bacterium]|jgi:two-component system sensor histidine kinase BaeS